jgi:hypothetical protein
VDVSLGTGTDLWVCGCGGLGCDGGCWWWWEQGYDRTTYGGVPLWEIDRRVDVGEERAVVKPAPVDEALAALREGRYVMAKMMYLERARAEAGVDARAMRLAGLAAAGEGRFEEAERLLEEAYAADTGLEGTPMEGRLLIGGGLELREIVNGAVAHAQRTGRAASWEMVAVLMQSEGRFDVARRMAERAGDIRNAERGERNAEGSGADEVLAAATGEGS